MAERRIYWLELPQGFLDSLVVKKLRLMAGGDTYTIIALKILLKGLSEDSVIKYQGIEDTFAKELALELGESAIDVEVVVGILLACKWLIRENKKTYIVSKAQEMMGSESASAERKRKSRENKKLLAEKEDICIENFIGCDIVTEVSQNVTAESQSVTDLSQGCHTEKEQETEKYPKEKEQAKRVKETCVNTSKEKEPISERSEVQKAVDRWLFTCGYPGEHRELRVALEDFSEMRKKLRKPLTAKATVLNLNKALELAGGRVDEMARIFEQSTANGWQGVFALREDFSKPAASSRAPVKGGKAGFTVEGQTEIEAEEVQM